MKFFIEFTGPHSHENALWWRPERRGYTTNLDEAGQYDESDARGIEGIRGQERAWPVDEVLAIAHRSASLSKLRPLGRRDSQP